MIPIVVACSLNICHQISSPYAVFDTATECIQFANEMLLEKSLSEYAYSQFDTPAQFTLTTKCVTSDSLEPRK